jgi:hypothetical protein
MDLLIVADLFVVGLALDLAGAFLLSRGLLAAYPTLTRRAGTYWNGNPHVAVGLAEDRIDGRFGVTYLALGFGLQVVGYVLDLAFNPGAEASGGRALVALGLAAATVAGAWLLWRWQRRELLKRTILEMAYWNTSHSELPPNRLTNPDTEALESGARRRASPLTTSHRSGVLGSSAGAGTAGAAPLAPATARGGTR